jgi:hypothetical protein
MVAIWMNKQSYKLLVIIMVIEMGKEAPYSQGQPNCN